MADPLSISAGIAGLATLADLVFCRTYKYVQATRRASTDISTLTIEIGALYGILSNLKLVSDQLQDETVHSTAQVHHIESCYRTLEEVRTILDRDRTSSLQNQPLEVLKRKLHWPLTSCEVKKLTAEFERHKTTLGLALNVDSMSGLLQSLSIQREVRNTVDMVKIELRQRHEAETRVAITKERQNILKSFGKSDPSRYQRMGLKLQQPGTGLWLPASQEFQNWLSTDHAKLWLYGIPGAGKTVLAAVAIEEVLRDSRPNVAVAFFYCDYMDPATQTPALVLGSLVQQIAKQDERSFEKVQTFCKSRNPDHRDDIDYDPEELRNLLSDMTVDFDCTTVVVDGLDECGTNTIATVEFLASLNLAKTGDEANVKTLFLSRDEVDIRLCLADYIQVAIAAKSSDLRLYVGSEIDSRIRKNKLRIKDNSLQP